MKRSTTFASAISACIIAACGGDHSRDRSAGGDYSCIENDAPQCHPPFAAIGGSAGDPGEGTGSGVAAGGADGYAGKGTAGSVAAGGTDGDTGVGFAGMGSGGYPPTMGSGGYPPTMGSGGGGVAGSGVDPCPWVTDCYARIDSCRNSGAAGCDGMIPTCGQLAVQCGSPPPAADPAACRHNVDVCLSQYDDCVALGDMGCLHIIDVCAALAHDCE